MTESRVRCPKCGRPMPVGRDGGLRPCIPCARQYIATHGPSVLHTDIQCAEMVFAAGVPARKRG